MWKELDYLDLQGNVLTEEHNSLNQISQGVMGRTVEI